MNRLITYLAILAVSMTLLSTQCDDPEGIRLGWPTVTVINNSESDIRVLYGYTAQEYLRPYDVARMHRLDKDIYPLIIPGDSAIIHVEAKPSNYLNFFHVIIQSPEMFETYETQKNPEPADNLFLYHEVTENEYNEYGYPTRENILIKYTQDQEEVAVQ